MVFFEPWKTEIHELYGANEFLKEVPKLFDKAKEEILMTTGLSSEFYNKDEVKNALLNATGRGVKIKIIVDGGRKDLDKELSWPKWDWIVKEIKSKNIEIKKYKNRIRHMIIVDKIHSRSEEPHSIQEENFDKRKNKIFYNDPAAEYIKIMFEGMWDECENINLE